jgi:hypothetical protein
MKFADIPKPWRYTLIGTGLIAFLAACITADWLEEELEDYLHKSAVSWMIDNMAHRPFDDRKQ